MGQRDEGEEVDRRGEVPWVDGNICLTLYEDTSGQARKYGSYQQADACFPPPLIYCLKKQSKMQIFV